MKTIFLIVLLCTFLISINAWVALIQYDPKEIPPGHTGHCFTNHYSLGSLKKHEEKRIKEQCAIAKCGVNKDISLFGCGVVQVSPPCVVVDGDLSKPYPDCCHEIKCPEDNRID